MTSKRDGFSVAGGMLTTFIGTLGETEDVTPTVVNSPSP